MTRIEVQENASRLEMKEAAARLAEVTRLIIGEYLGNIVVMPIVDASRAFRISKETFCVMEARRQELIISAKKDKVFVKLQSGEGQRVEDYNFLYGLIQSIRDGSEQQYLDGHEVPESLLEQFSSIREDIVMAKKGIGGFGEEDLKFLHLNLYALWFSVKHRGVENWENVF